MAETLNIAVDIMGGDYAPRAIVEGVGEALDMYPDRFRLFLVGEPTRMEEELRRIGKWGDARLELVPATEVIGMGEHPVAAVRKKRNSSINVAINLVRTGKASAVFSAGSTGAVVASAFFKLSMLPGIERPGIAAVLPTETDRFLLLDAGATVDCTPLNLLHYATMGSIYASTILKKENPKVGLLSNGTEEGKGNRLTQQALPLLQEAKNLNFIGNVEGHDLFSDNVDVVVCDGFVGNVTLKSAEQLAKALGHIIKHSIMGKLQWKLGGLLSKGAFNEVRKRTDASEVGGCPLLGVAGVCIIGHGISDAKAVRNGIRVAGECIEARLNDTIAEQIRSLGIKEP